MEKTIRLFDSDSHLYEFDATVLSCVRSDAGFDIILDKTAFFPEEGGQNSDDGEIGGVRVLHVSDEGGIIVHTLEKPFDIGTSVHCVLDREARFRKMQNHSGEHIISGIAHNLYGADNVGFHLGSHDTTADFNVDLSKEQIERIEYEANAAVFKNLCILTYYPPADKLASIEYRSKLDLKENVRIVEIEGLDKCACCAPHVNTTGEIGLIKIISFIRFKGGVRLHILCGYDALDDYINRCRIAGDISKELSLPQEKIFDGVKRLEDDIFSLRGEILSLRNKALEKYLNDTKDENENICIFDSSLGDVQIREFINRSAEHCNICAVFFGKNENGYRYIIGSGRTDLRKLTKKINAALCGRGGGSDSMIQGSAGADEETIRTFFSSAISAE